MSDAADAVKEAITLNKRLAARHLVHAEDLAAQLDMLKRDRADADGDPQLAAAFDAKIADVNTQFLAAKYDYDVAMRELAALDSLGGKALAVDAKTIAASIHGDPLLRSADQIALDNVRERAADLDAQQKLAEELGEQPRAAVAKPSREAADEEALRAFEVLRAKQQVTAAAASDDAVKPAPQASPKKTL
jgi:hypothetical protein